MDLISRYFETLLIFSPKACLRFVELVDIIKIKASLSFNASYLLNTSAWTPEIKWTPREFIRLFRVIKYDVICEAYFVQIAAFG